MKVETTQKFGRWVYDSKLMTLELEGYQVDLEPITSAAEILDWVCEIHGKTWITPQDIHDFLRALKLLLNLRANFCAFGKDKRTSAKKILQS